MANTKKTYFKKTYVGHLLFWASIFLYFILSVNINNYSGYKQLFESVSITVFSQIITAYITIYILIPKFLNTKKTFLFIFWLLLLMIGMFAAYNFFRVYHYDPKYFDFYSPTAKEYAKKPYLDRLLNCSVFLSKVIKFLTPAALLLMSRFYKNQQKYLKLNEQKKIAELTALKHQLNPHFLFNTLNNLYALAIEKSERTPEVIERLSDILDYMLYRCNDNFVSLQKEIELIEHYLALEKIRYGKRVDISFKKEVENDIKIAPLLLLTFVENSFKHGVSQELKKAKINITIRQQNKNIIFSIFNTKPKKTLIAENFNDKALGLKNVKKQLELLYPNMHDLDIKDGNSFSLTLTLAQK